MKTASEAQIVVATIRQNVFVLLFISTSDDPTIISCVIGMIVNFSIYFSIKNKHKKVCIYVI